MKKINLEQFNQISGGEKIAVLSYAVSTDGVSLKCWDTLSKFVSVDRDPNFTIERFNSELIRFCSLHDLSTFTKLTYNEVPFDIHLV